MKYFIYISVLIFFASCTHESSEADYLPKFEVGVPEQLGNNKEAVCFIQKNEELLNKWSVDFEDLLVAYEPYLDKEDKEFNALEKLKKGRLSIEYLSLLSEFTADVAKIQQDISFIEDGLTESEKKAFAEVVNQIALRIGKIDGKYEMLIDYDDLY